LISLISGTNLSNLGVDTITVNATEAGLEILTALNLQTQSLRKSERAREIGYRKDYRALLEAQQREGEGEREARGYEPVAFYAPVAWDSLIWRRWNTSARPAQPFWTPKQTV